MAVTIHRETTESSERIYEGKIVNLRVDTVRFQNDKTGKREVVEHSGAVAIVPVLADGKTVVLVRQWRTPVGAPLLEIPAGGLEKGENPEECARRELTEEIGQTAGHLVKLYEGYSAPGFCNEKLYGFLALDLSDESADHDEDEFVERIEMPLAEAIAAIATGEIQDMKTIAGLTLADRYLAN
ncbi:MAG: NUDIX hydrolase, partial [Armatimonadetes bacterium]|nr:NUDIX hydrolase [Armatimonadota bacterium]